MPPKRKKQSTFANRKRVSTATAGDWRCRQVIREAHREIIYGLAVCPFGPEPRPPGDPYLFATASDAQLMVYALYDDKVELLQCYKDSLSKDCFWCVCWVFNEEEDWPLLCAAGKSGCIRVICVKRKDFIRQMDGHYSAVNDLRCCLSKPFLMASASNDYDVILWNAVTSVAIARFGQLQGHHVEVLSCDISVDGSLLASSDCSSVMKVWSLESDDLNEAIEESRHFKHDRTFPTRSIDKPIVTTQKHHKDVADCIRFFGHLIVTKGCDSTIVLWKTGTPANNWDLKNRNLDGDPTVPSVTTYRTLYYRCHETWYYKFDLDPNGRLLACGNEFGQLYVWHFARDGKEAEPSVLTHRKLPVSMIRQTAITPDLKTIICVSDDARLYCWRYVGQPVLEHDFSKISAIHLSADSLSDDSKKEELSTVSNGLLGCSSELNSTYSSDDSAAVSRSAGCRGRLLRTHDDGSSDEEGLVSGVGIPKEE